MKTLENYKEEQVSKIYLDLLRKIGEIVKEAELELRRLK